MTELLFEIAEETPKTAHRAPEELNPIERRELERWAEERSPWITRGALDSLTPLEEYEDACLSYFRGKKTMRVGWLGSVKNWIRRDERRRLTIMARQGNSSARLALRDPVAWRKRFDGNERSLKEIEAPKTLIIPKQNQSARKTLFLSRRA